MQCRNDITTRSSTRTVARPWCPSARTCQRNKVDPTRRRRCQGVVSKRSSESVLRSRGWQIYTAFLFPHLPRLWMPFGGIRKGPACLSLAHPANWTFCPGAHHSANWSLGRAPRGNHAGPSSVLGPQIASCTRLITRQKWAARAANSSFV